MNKESNAPLFLISIMLINFLVLGIALTLNINHLTNRENSAVQSNIKAQVYS